MLELQTNLGKIVIELNREQAPATVENVIAYANSGFYEGTLFHRVIDGFMIQGGGLDQSMNRKETQAPVKNESVGGAKNIRMSVAMARLAEPDSATSQFFINLKDNTNLDAQGGEPGYSVFGQVIAGEDVVEKIAKLETGSVGMYGDVPTEPVIIEKATIITDD